MSHKTVWITGASSGIGREFARRYAAELKGSPAFAALLETIASKPKVTLLYSSHDRAHNNAEVVAAALASEGWKCGSA